MVMRPFKRMIGIMLFLITGLSLLTFVFGPFVFSKILPDYDKIVSNFMCGVAGVLTPPIVKAGLLHISIFSLILSLIMVLFLWDLNRNSLFKLIIFLFFFILFEVLGLIMINGKPIPWIGGDDIGFSVGLTTFMTFFAVAPFIKNKPVLLAIILLMFVVFWGIYKFSGIIIARKAEDRGAENCLEEFPLEVPQVTEEGKIRKVKIPYKIFKPTFMIGAFLALVSFGIFIITLMKVKS